MILDINHCGNKLLEHVPNFERICKDIKNELIKQEFNRLKVQSLLFELISESGSVIPYFRDFMESGKQILGKTDLADEKNNLIMKIFRDSYELATIVNTDNVPIEECRNHAYRLISLTQTLLSFFKNEIKPLLQKPNENITEHNLDKYKVTLQQDKINEIPKSSFQNKQNYIMANVVEIGPKNKGIYFKIVNLDTFEKIDYHLKIEFWVAGRGKHSIKDGIKWYVMDHHDFLNWEHELLLNWESQPDNALHIGDKTIQEEYFLSFNPNQEGHLYVILDNRMAEDYTQHVALTITESWKESTPQTDIVTTLPTEDESLKLQIENLIDNSKKTLKIISPYIDSTYLTKLVQKRRQQVEINIITRKDDKLEAYAKAELDLVKNEFPKNVVEHEKIHSRLIIRDDEEMLISSADLNKRSSHNQANLGIRVIDPKLVKQTVVFFNKIYHWQKNDAMRKLFGDSIDMYDNYKK